jgi:hypothetical protein
MKTENIRSEKRQHISTLLTSTVLIGLLLVQMAGIRTGYLLPCVGNGFTLGVYLHVIRHENM